MNYKDTIIKQCEIDWKSSKIKHTKDGKIDLKFTIPLTAILDTQAKRAFMQGIVDTLGFVGECQSRQIAISKELLDAKFSEWGIPELSVILKAGDKFVRDAQGEK